MKDVILSEILMTRLSHDLIGNIGAVANAVELLGEEDNSDEDKKDITNILNFSANVLGKRLKFFRLCFGLSNTTLKNLDELYEIMADYLSTLGNPNMPITLEMKVETPQVYKLVMPAVMMMADVIIKGGKISVEQTENSLKITPSSASLLNASKLATIFKILHNEEINEQQSSFAPLYYLLAYLNNSGVKVWLNGDTLVIGE